MIDDIRQALPAAQTAITLGADKGYDLRQVIRAGATVGVVPQVAQKTLSTRLIVVATASS